VYLSFSIRRPLVDVLATKNVTNVRAAAIADADLCASTVDFRLPNSTKLPHDNDNIVSTVAPGIKAVLGLYR
jgi:hypothetical protein